VLADSNRFMAACIANLSNVEAKDVAHSARKAVQRAVGAARCSWVDSVLMVVNVESTVNYAN
jgi:hypothetical protein